MIFLAGHHGAGKSKSAGILMSYGFLSIDLGPTLRRIFLKSNVTHGFHEWIAEGETTVGPHFTDVFLVNAIKGLAETAQQTSAYHDIVVTGSRSPAGIHYICKSVPLVNGRRNVVIFIDAPFSLLRQRYNRREGKKLSRKEFSVLLEEDRKRGLDDIKLITDFHVWNDGDERKLRDRIEQIVFNELDYAKSKNPEHSQG